MKKSALLVALAFGSTMAFAQDLTSKKGEPYLPESGDWSIGIEAGPFLSYVGNMFNGTSGNGAPTWNFLNTNQTIVGKMFTSETMAYRGILRIGFTSNTSRAMVAQEGAGAPTYPALPSMVEDEWKAASHFIGLGGGMEMRRGKTRLQGVMGADAMIWQTGTKNTFTYGNAVTSGATVSTFTTNFASSGNITTDTYGNAARVEESKPTGQFGFGLRAFLGAEYFIFPKISIAGEFGWGVGITSNAGTDTKIESYGGTGVRGEQDQTGSKSGSFWVDVDRNAFGTGNGSLRLNLHF